MPDLCKCGCGLTAPHGYRYVEGHRLFAPCGTPAALRRHLRNGEKPCEECRLAGIRYGADRRGNPAARMLEPDRREVRNHLPIVPFYSYRARTYPWAQRAIQHAEAVHGKPADGAW
jgi:hypothetical protein